MRAQSEVPALYKTMIEECCNVVAANGETPFHALAASNFQLSGVFFDYLRAGAKLFAADHKGRTPFSILCQRGKLYTASVLIKRGYVGPHNVEEWCTRESTGETPLVHMAQVSQHNPPILIARRDCGTASSHVAPILECFVFILVVFQALSIASVVYQVRQICSPFCQLLSFVRGSAQKHLEVLRDLLMVGIMC
jgi:hypothetical protein